MALLQRLIALVTFVIATSVSTAAFADHHVHANDDGNYLNTDANDGQPSSNQTPSSDGPSTDPAVNTPTVSTHIVPVCEDHGDLAYNAGFACGTVAQCETSDGTHSYLVQEVTFTDPPVTLAAWCVGEEEIQNIQPTVTPGLVLDAFKKISLPKSELVIQPPKGKAPVNFNVIYSTIAEDQDQSVELLGQTVYLKIWPSVYTWHTGDGSEDIVTDWPGRVFDRAVPDPENYVWHRYLESGAVQPAVDVTYSAEFSVGDQSHWQPVDGTVTVEGDPSPLTITPYNPVLSGH